MLEFEAVAERREKKFLSKTQLTISFTYTNKQTYRLLYFVLVFSLHVLLFLCFVNFFLCSVKHRDASLKFHATSADGFVL